MKRVVVAAFGFVFAMGGCASVNPIKVAEAAPVTHRLGEGGYDHASVKRSVPSYSVPELRSPAPRMAAPKRIEPRNPASQAVSAPFDKKNVDTELYAHQRVGKSYKVFGKRYTPKHQPNYDKTGTASWYGPKFHGKPTASGEAFDMNGLSAAHKTLPLNSLVHVTNLENGRSIVLRVNDRGPFVGDRIIDLSKGAAAKLGLLESGLKEVRVRYAGPADPNDAKPAKRKPIPQAPRSVAEAPKPETKPAPKPAPRTPGFELEGYKPLRKLPEASVTPQAALPEAPLPQAVPYTPPGMSQSYTAPSLPQLKEVQPETPADEPLTLTIKGPIHMATSKRIPHAERIIGATHK